jgi:hypothetical protein
MKLWGLLFWNFVVRNFFTNTVVALGGSENGALGIEIRGGVVGDPPKLVL